MRQEQLNFDVTPLIVRAGHEASISIRPRADHARFHPEDRYFVTLLPLEGLAGQTRYTDAPRRPVAPVDGVLRVNCSFAGEQEYGLLLDRVAGEETARLAEFRLFALDEDLFTRRPYKGDLHLHSAYSDGRESPAHVAGACRRIGLDFMAVTDHQRYAPSVEAARAYDGIDVDLRIYPGEEVHPPDNPVHIVNFGGRFSVSALVGTDRFEAEVRALARSLTDLPPETDTSAYAACVWCFEQIRKGGGLGLFCHPYWLHNGRYDCPGYLTNLLLDRQPFDALEVIGGYHRSQTESNILQVARYHEERARGRRIPVVGASDAHGCERDELFGWYYTVVFAPSPALPDLIASIRNLLSVAVEALPGERAFAYGPFRLVRYTQFLLREVFPRHDELCAEEGRLMLAHPGGDARAASRLREYAGRTARLYAQLYGGEADPC